MKNYEIKAKVNVGNEQFPQVEDKIFIVDAENLYEALLYVKKQNGYVEMCSAKPSAYHIIEDGQYWFWVVITKHCDDAGRERKIKHIIRATDVKNATAKACALFAGDRVFKFHICGVLDTDIYMVAHTDASLFDDLTDSEKEDTKKYADELEQMELEFEAEQMMEGNE